MEELAPCAACAGELIEAGTLGNTRYAICRSCGSMNALDGASLTNASTRRFGHDPCPRSSERTLGQRSH